MSSKVKNKNKVAKLTRNHFLTASNTWEKNLCGWELKPKQIKARVTNESCLKYLWERIWWNEAYQWKLLRNATFENFESNSLLKKLI